MPLDPFKNNPRSRTRSLPIDVSIFSESQQVAMAASAQNVVQAVEGTSLTLKQEAICQLAGELILFLSIPSVYFNGINVKDLKETEPENFKSLMKRMDDCLEVELIQLNTPENTQMRKILEEATLKLNQCRKIIQEL